LRIYLRVEDSEDKYAELDHTKAGFLKGDIIVTHDKDTLHELQGLALIAGRKLIVRVLEPGKELVWDGSMSSPWHVNTDSYVLTFDTSPTLHTPHLLFNCL
jgi:hypothetical protein